MVVDLENPRFKVSVYEKVKPEDLERFASDILLIRQARDLLFNEWPVNVHYFTASILHVLLDQINVDAFLSQGLVQRS